MALCCCAVRKSTVPKRSESQKTAEPHTTHATPDSHELIPAILDPALDPAVSQPRPAGVDEFRRRSASDPHRPGTRIQKSHLRFHTPSLRDIPEETTSNTLQVDIGQVQTLTSTLSCISGLSDISSVYHTPLSTLPRRCTTTFQEHEDHPQTDGNEVEKRTQYHGLSFDSALSSKHSVSQEHAYHFKTLIERMGKAEQERRKQHMEMKEIISGLTQRLEELESEKCKEQQERATPDRDGMLNTSASQLPQNCSVSTAVLVRLAKRVTQWRFLARRLHIEEHDIQQIGVDFPASIQEQSYQMLLKWKLSLSCNNDAYHTMGEAVREEFGETLYSDYVTMVQEAEGNSCQ